jgi:hypothetical protein
MKLRIKTTGHKDDSTIQELSVPDIIEADVTAAQIQYMLSNNIPFDGVEAYVEIPIGNLTDNVPNNFLYSTIWEDDTERQRYWSEYTQYWTNDTNALLKVGRHKQNGTRPRPVDYIELQDWIDEFGSGNLILPDAAKIKIETEYNNA